MPPRRDARLVGAVLLLANVGLVCVVWNSQQRQWLFEDWQEAEEEVMATGDFNARDPLKAPQPSKGFLSEWRKEAPRRRLDSTGTVFKPDKKRAFPANRVKYESRATNFFCITRGYATFVSDSEQMDGLSSAKLA